MTDDRVRMTGRWRDPRVIAFLLCTSSTALLVSIPITGVGTIEAVLVATATGVLLSLIFAAALGDGPIPSEARPLVLIFAIQAAVSVFVWAAVRLM